MNVTLVLSWEDGKPHGANTVNVPAQKYQKVELVGTSTAVGILREVKPHTLQDSWGWNWDRK